MQFKFLALNFLLVKYFILFIYFFWLNTLIQVLWYFTGYLIYSPNYAQVP